MPALSIVIVNYNTFELTCACVRSIRQHTKLFCEIIVVDNGSVECDPQLFLKELPGIHLVPLATNEGFSRGNNAGIACATAPVVLLLNSDTIVFDDALERTYRFLMQNPAVGLAGCKLLNEDRTEQLSSFIPVYYPLLNLFVGSNVFLQKFLSVTALFPSYSNHLAVVLAYQRHTHACDAVSGAFMMVRAEVIQACGPFDPDFFLYCEETEWCRNRIAKQFRIMYYADAAIVHLGGKSSRSIAVEKQMMLSSFLYNYKIGWWHYAATLLIYSVNMPLNLLALPFLKPLTRKSTWRMARIFATLLPVLFFDIPRYTRKPGSRPAPLKITEYQKR